MTTLSNNQIEATTAALQQRTSTATIKTTTMTTTATNMAKQ